MRLPPFRRRLSKTERVAASQGGPRGSARRRLGVFAATLSLVGALLLAPTTGAPTAAAAAGEAEAAAVAAPAGLPSAIAPVPTADLSLFRPGRIIDDAVFFNKGTMTEAQIQSFLQARVPACQSGYTCLKDWYDTSRTTTADAMCGAYQGGTRERASRIIYKVAQACGINPQVILATLQKEQGLVTHTWPSEFRYTIAMGQGCPDTAACDTRYYGFFNQVYGAAWQLKRYANPPGTSQYFTWYAPGKTWNVRYHPNVSCGSSPVRIENQATANLYYYTPYQPNAASIRAGSGTGDSCSSYGNRNFYRYFVDWFGPTVSTSPRPVTSIDTATHLLARDAAGTLWAHVATGKGGWNSRVSLGNRFADAARIITPGDLDGDGRRDLIGVTAAGAVLLYRGRANLAYAEPVTLRADWSKVRLVAGGGDFSGDGVPDVFTTDSTGTLHLWRGTGGAGLRAPIAIGARWNGIDMLVGSGDFDGDRAADLLARSTDGGLWLYSGTGRGGFKAVTKIGKSWGRFRTIEVVGDFNSDKRPDIIAVDARGDALLYSGIGGGRLRGDGRVGSGFQAMSLIAGPGVPGAGVRVLPPGAGDADGDGARDVSALTTGGALMLYRGNAKGGWAGTRTVTEGWATGVRTISLGDFDGDGAPDIGRISGDGRFHLLSGNGKGGYAAPREIGRGWQTTDLIVGAIDVDRDRRPDVLARDATGALRLYRGNGAGGWAADAGAVVGTGWGGMNAIFAAGDFDGDRRPDVLARTKDGRLLLYSGDGAGGWLGSRQIGNGWNGMTFVFSPGNFDGAGGMDVLARRADGTLWLYSGDGRGGWSGYRQIGRGWNGIAWMG